MFVSISALLNSLCNMMSKLFEFKTVQTENIQSTEIIKDKRDYKKASDIAEKIVSIAHKYKKYMTFADRLRFSHLCESFFKYN